MRFPRMFLSCQVCFPGEALVQLESGETKKMEDVRSGDRVLTMKNNEPTYDTVYSFLHRETERVAKYLVIHHSAGGSLRISDNHMVFTSDMEAKAANKIAVNDQIVVSSENGHQFVQVTGISCEEYKGVYAPLTFNGTIVVDGVLASCYVEYDQMKSQRAMHAAMKPLRLKAKMLKNNRKQKELSGFNPYCTVLGTIYPVYKLTKVM